MTTGTQAVSLLDIAPACESVRVRGNQSIKVSGINLTGLAYLISRFPVIGELVSGGAADLSIEALTKLVPEAVAVIIAVGCGYIDEPKAEVSAKALPADVQANIFGVIVRLTLPEGLGPFVATLTDLGKSISVDGERKVSASGSPQPPKS